METTTNTTKTWTIGAGHEKAVREVFAKLAKRAAKLGVAAPSLEVSEVRKIVIGDFGREKAVVDVTTDIPVVKLGGWHFVAKLDATETTVPVIKAAPGQELTDAERERALEAGHECDHCCVNRARNVTYVVAHENGKRAQVGSTCVDDFLGHHAGREVGLLEAAWVFCGDMEEIGSRAPISWTLDSVLLATVSVIDEEGWIPRSRAFGGQCTADSVLTVLEPNPSQMENARKFWDNLTEKQTAKAQACREWLGTITPDNDYLYNLKAVHDGNIVTYKLLGIACSAVAAYDRAMERELKRRNDAEKTANSQHLGEVKKRQSFGQVTIQALRYVDGMYGTTTVVKMVDDAGNVLTWFASNAPTMEVGDRFELTATVKKHDEFKGVKQTVVTRAKLVATAKAA